MRRIGGIVLFGAASLYAHAGQFGHWQTGSLHEGSTFYAGTTNDSGGILAKACFVGTQQCVWKLSLADRCELGDSYVALLNAKSGVHSIKVDCERNTDKEGNHLVLDYESMESVLTSKDPSVGIALAMQDGGFKVVRFNMSGANLASEEIEERTTRAARESTRDIRL